MNVHPKTNEEIKMKTLSKKLAKLALLTAATIIGFNSDAYSAVSTNQRVLVVVTELDSHGFPELRPMYAALEELTKMTTEGLLGNVYDKVEIITNRDATLSRFKEKIVELVRDQDVKAVDVILSLHGLKNKLAFDDKTWKMEDMVSEFKKASTIEDRVARILMRKKLRMIYNLSCYGSSHRQAFLDIGFKAANGSVGVNANSELEFAPALIAWRSGVGFKDSFSLSNTNTALLATDEPIKALGELMNNALKDTDSRKLFSGNQSIKISSDAN